MGYAIIAGEGEKTTGDAITAEEYRKLLSLAQTNVLEQVGSILIAVAERLPEGSPQSDALEAMLALLAMECNRRQTESLWRKAKRYARRNSDAFRQLGEIAAVIGLSSTLGI